MEADKATNTGRKGEVTKNNLAWTVAHSWEWVRRQEDFKNWALYAKYTLPPRL